MKGEIEEKTNEIRKTLASLGKRLEDGDDREMLGWVILKLTVGYSVFHFADVGDPLVLAWRPTYSQP